MLVSAGTIYASVNAGHNLSDWYNSHLKKESEKIGAATLMLVQAARKETTTFLLNSIRYVDSEIGVFQDKQVNDSKSGIETYQKDIKKRLDDTVTELEKVNFDDYADETKIEEELDQDIQDILAEVFK